MAQRKYDQALKDQAIEAVVKHGRSVAQTARDLDIAENTLYAMVAAYKRKTIWLSSPSPMRRLNKKTLALKKNSLRLEWSVTC